MKLFIPFVLLMGMITGCAFQYQVDDHESRISSIESKFIEPGVLKAKLEKIDELDIRIDELDIRIDELNVKMFQGLMLAAQKIDELEMFNEEMTIKEAIKVLNENDQAAKELFEKVRDVLILMDKRQDLYEEENID